MLSILRQNIPRTKTSHLNPVTYEDGRASQHFHDAMHQYLVTHTIPATTAEHGRSFVNPPPHFHMYQTEDFEIISGIGRFFLDGKTTIAKPGDKVHIPMMGFHCFENASETGEDLVVSVRLDEQDFKNEERFFRNFFGYFDDLRQTGQQPSFFQLCLFLYTIRCPVVMPGADQKSNYIGRQISWLVMVIAGLVIGEWLLGYKKSYPEYFSDSEQKKGQ